MNPAPEGLLLRLEARRVVRGRLRRPEPPRSGPRVPLADRDLYWVESLRVIGPDRPGDDEEQRLVGRFESDVGLGRDHRRPHVERGPVRPWNPLVVELEERLDGADEDGRVHFGQIEAHRRRVEARRVVGRPEQVHGPRATAVPVRLEPLEYRLTIVQDKGGRREVEVREGPYGGVAPAAVRGPAHREHVIAVDLPEPERTLVRRLRSALLRRRRLDPEVHAPPPRLPECRAGGPPPAARTGNLGRPRPQSQARVAVPRFGIAMIARRRSAIPPGAEVRNGQVRVSAWPTSNSLRGSSAAELGRWNGGVVYGNDVHWVVRSRSAKPRSSRDWSPAIRVTKPTADSKAICRTIRTLDR